MTYPSDNIVDDGQGGWYSAMCRCRMCGYEQASVFPVNVLDETCLECGNCGHMTSEPFEYFPPNSSESS